MMVLPLEEDLKGFAPNKWSWPIAAKILESRTVDDTKSK